MTFINYNDTLGMVFQSASLNITGSEFLTLFLMIIFMVTLLAIFKVPVEFILIIILPFIIYVWSYYAGFTAVAGVILMFLAVIFARKFFLN